MEHSKIYRYKVIQVKTDIITQNVHVHVLHV